MEKMKVAIILTMLSARSLGGILYTGIGTDWYTGVESSDNMNSVTTFFGAVDYSNTRDMVCAGNYWYQNDESDPLPILYFVDAQSKTVPWMLEL